MAIVRCVVYMKSTLCNIWTNEVILSVNRKVNKGNKQASFKYLLISDGDTAIRKEDKCT